MKSTLANLAFAVLVGSTLTACSAAPGDEMESFDDGSEALKMDASNVYVLDKTALGTSKCTARTGQTGRWNATVLGRSVALQNFCVFEWVGTGAPETALLPRGVSETTTARKTYGDIPVVAPSATPLVDATWGKLRTGLFKASSAVSVPVPTSAPKSFVAVVDSARDETASNEASLGTYEHGELVGRIVREESRGSVGVLSTLALPRTSTGAIDLKGGYFGYASDTALAIVRAVDAWRARTANDGLRRPLVVNLSLGWEPLYYYGAAVSGATSPVSTYAATSVLSIPQRSVFAAIEYANCAGALVLAAAGNVSSGAGATKTMTFPAAWEAVPAPTAARCDQFGLSSTARPTPRLNASPRMVYAVGAVDGADAEVFNARPTGVPRLVAYGHAVSVSRAGSTTAHTGVMTGSSMSVAVASSAASIGWAFVPATSAHDVAQVLYEQSVSLARPAKDCSLGMCNTRRVSLCGTITKLSGLASSCTTMGAFAGSVVKTGVSPESLGIPFVNTTPGAAVAPSSALVNEMINPTVKPMPVSGGCDLCGFYSSAFYFDFSYPSATVGATISLDTGLGMSLVPSTEYMMFSLPSSSTTPTSGTITFTDSLSGWTSTQQIFFF